MTEVDIDREIDFLVSPRDFVPSASGGAYEAADRTNRDLLMWAPPVQSVDADVIPSKTLADARANDLTRNDAYVASGVRLHQDSIVGAQYRLNAAPITSLLNDTRLDETWADEFQAEVEDLFSAWAESEMNWVDASRRNTFTSLIRLAVGVHLVSGESLATVEWMRDMPRPMQTAIQMIEIGRLCDPMDRDFDRARVRGGIEMDSYGAPIAYYIRRAMPDRIAMRPDESWKWSRVLAMKPRLQRRQVIHIVEQGRPSQTRGISQMLAAMKEMQITKRFRDITLQNAVVNASFAASIESELPTQAIFESLGGGNVAEAITSYSQNYLEGVLEYTSSARNMHLDGVKIPHFYPGTKLNLTPMGKPGGVGQEFEASLLRYLAANLGVSYEELAKDYRETNYSSARAGLLGTWKYMQARKRIVADRMANAIYRLFLEEALGRGMVTSMPSNAPNWYEGFNAEAYSHATWIGAGFGQIDELKETQAARLRLDSGLSTFEKEFGRQGLDWRDALRQRKREQDFIEEIGLELPSQQSANEVNAISGNPREANSGEADTPGGSNGN